LQHDLGEPYAIRILRILPWQIVTSVSTLPRDDSIGEFHRGFETY
jgi:hypothetical protein